MKILIVSIATTATMLFNATTKAQTRVSLKEDAYAPSISQLTIDNVDIKQAENGFKVTWEAHNQFQVARYELQLSDDNSNFSTVKRRTAPASVNGKYEAVLSNTIILANPVYYRIKVVSLDGKEAYTESYRVRIDG